MVSSPKVQYFLGANSPSGFYSLYSELLPPEQARGIYILKGGPGCGKSTLMRRIAALAEETGEPVEYILCSGDPASLDAVVLPEKRIALVDGTAPHVVVPYVHQNFQMTFTFCCPVSGFLSQISIFSTNPTTNSRGTVSSFKSSCARSSRPA